MPPQNAERVIESALAARDAGRPADALAPLKAALEAEPDNLRLWQTLGGIHRALEDSGAAIAAFSQAARCAPGNVKALHGLAQASLEAGRPAIALFDRVMHAAPGDGSVLLGRAAAQLAEGDGSGAIADLDTIVAANPFWLDGHVTLARLRWQLGHRDHHVASIERALVTHPQVQPLWMTLVQTLVAVEDFTSALQAIARAQKALNDHGGFGLVEAYCASELGELDRANARFAQVEQRDHPEFLEKYARHLLKCGRPEAALHAIEPALGRAGDTLLWSYASLGWRLTGDPRAAWLEGDPAFIGVVDIGSDAIDGLADRLRALHRSKGAPAGQSVRGGTQTDGPLFAHESVEIRRLRSTIDAAVREHIRQLGATDPGHPTRRHIGKPIRFAGSWSVRLTGAGHHSSHIHPLGWISSALYVALPTAHQMGPQPAGWLQLGAPPAQLGLDLPPHRLIEPKVGRLVLFPSTMWHGTMPIASGERLSVAFDVAAVG